MDQVVCIRDDWDISDIAPDGAKYLPVKGTIYTIREREDIFMLWHGRMKTYFRFEELRNTPKPLADGKLFEITKIITCGERPDAPIIGETKP